MENLCNNMKAAILVNNAGEELHGLFCHICRPHGTGYTDGMATENA